MFDYQRVCPSEISKVGKMMGMKPTSVRYKFQGQWHSDPLFHARHIQTSAMSNLCLKFQFIVAYIHTLLFLCCQEWRQSSLTAQFGRVYPFCFCFFSLYPSLPNLPTPPLKPRKHRVKAFVVGATAAQPWTLGV